jgi:hypothetical protein
MPADGDLIVKFDLPPKVNRGEFVCGVVRVRNQGEASREVSARLNLFEGDLRARLTGPDGRGRRIHGAYQVDSAPRRVSLDSGQALESGVFLFFTSAGLTFADAGEYRLQLEYDPSVRETIVSDEQRLVVHEVGSEKERALATITLNVDLGRAVALAEPSPGEGKTRLEQLATSFGDRTEGRVAALVLSAGKDKSAIGRLTETFSDMDAVELAHWVSALATPASSRGRALTGVFDSLRMSSRPRTRAQAIVAGQPHRVEAGR